MTRMSHADAAWLHMETPTNLMMITGLVLLDSVPERAWMESVLEYRLCHFERFRMKVVELAGLGCRIGSERRILRWVLTWCMKSWLSRPWSAFWSVSRS